MGKEEGKKGEEKDVKERMRGEFRNNWTPIFKTDRRYGFWKVTLPCTKYAES